MTTNTDITTTNETTPERAREGRRVVSRWWVTSRRCASGQPNSSIVPAMTASS